MPLIQVKTSVSQPESNVIESLLTTLSAKLAQHLGKPESYVMTSFDSDIKMTFSGTFDPVCYLEVKSVGNMSPSQTKAMSDDFCQVIEDTLGVDKNRTYIEFADAKGSMWGWNGKTF
ncbi:putative macrophage migration inhibitory factor [Crocosphaera subtropica ATCC 51142]|uniref:L-dopachrome isomerase n=1 Tax=Crocosphaera subtropica (strain ATCC 51142 / BH68) TaxID=43989 RepID=B1WNK5_CROS5|nr:phenylpyruvate tautomerase MIF-related protein [Crocosphaera subtropica]ACB51434.1 putative macrophage migration inhibitory factor [Crocosphaera subtropica ATCC 51142]